MKYLKKSLCLVATLTLSFMLCVSASAGDISYEKYPYYVEDYKIDAILEENNVISVTETILVNYNDQRQGIIRSLPVKPQIDKLVNGEYKTMTYKTKIEDLMINENFEEYEEDGYLFIKIGEEGKYNIGQKEYVMSYTMDIGDDRIDSFDEVFYSFIGTDWDCPIKNASFSFQFPKAFDKDEIMLYSGEFGTQESNNIEYQINGNTISGEIINSLYPYEGVTLYTQLPEGFFIGETTVNMLPAIVMTIIALGLFAVIVYLVFASKKSREVVQTVEFYPPDDITSAQVGYIMDGSTSDNEVLSLIVWMADKKYIMIEEKTKGITILSKSEKSIENMPSHIKPLYDGIFENGDSVDVASLNLYDSVNAVKGITGTHFKGKFKLQETAIHGSAIVAAIALAVVGSIGLALYGGMVYDLMIICGILVFVFSVLLLIICEAAASGWSFLTKGKRNAYMISIVVILCVLVFITFAMSMQTNLVPIILPIFTAAITAIGCSLSAFTVVYTEYMRSIRGKLLGLQEFIDQAEKEKLEELVMENPEYFFNVLPYAYVFGLTDKWINQFEKINIAMPETAATMMRTCYIVNVARIGMTPPIDTQSMTSGKSFGSSYSGGGFSGGGFGGGGGRSW